MKKISLLLALFALTAGPSSLAADATGDEVKRLPDLKVEDPVSEKPLKNADNADIDAELRAILDEAEEEEQSTD